MDSVQSILRFISEGGRMRELLLTLASWLHLVAAVTWIGGIGFVIFIAIPSARQIMGADAGKLVGEISRRFTLVANCSIVLLVLTGLAMPVLTDGNPVPAANENYWLALLAAKILLVLAMITIHIYRGRVLAPKIISSARRRTRKRPLCKNSPSIWWK